MDEIIESIRRDFNIVIIVMSMQVYLPRNAIKEKDDIVTAI